MKTRLKKIQPKRTKSGQFETLCKCILHKETTKNKVFVHLENARKVSKELILHMLDKKLIENTRGKICLECVKDIKHSLHYCSQKQTTMSVDDDSSDLPLLSEASSSTFSCPFLPTSVEEASSSGSCAGIPECMEKTDCFEVTKLMETDIAKLYKEKSCSSVEKVLTYCPKKWLENRPKPIVECFAKLCNQDPSSEIGSYSIAKAIEQTYNARYSMLVLPLSFRHNLVSYSLTGSKQLVKLYSSSSPSGSYTFITNWLSQNAKTEITFPERTVRVVFDNEQVVGKRYTVNVENFGVPISVITSHAYLEMDCYEEIQYSSTLSPKNWLVKPLDFVNQQKLCSFPDAYASSFGVTRNDFIKTRLKHLMQQQQSNHENDNKCFRDLVDDYVQEFLAAKTEKVCLGCGAPNDIDYRVCTNCKGKLAKRDVDIQCSIPEDHFDPYKHFSVPFTKNSTTIKVGEPDGVNPNSFENISFILRNLAMRAGIKKYDSEKSREWIYLESDGGIYTILTKLIENVFKCKECKA